MAKEFDVAIVGTGIMGGTIAAFIKRLQPTWRIIILERLGRIAGESTNPWNNAGTGHAANCELNYTDLVKGKIVTDKAVHINEDFEVSLQLWSHFVDIGWIKDPRSFINKVPHISLVFGEENVKFLKMRFNAMKATHLFDEMEYTEDHDTLSKWLPLVMNGRSPSEKIAATRVEHGTDVDFGSLTKQIFDNVTKEGAELYLNHLVTSLKKSKSGGWSVKVRDNFTGDTSLVKSRFVFIGAGGGALPLLKESGIEEAEGFGGFPVSGQFLVCTNSELIEKHQAKAYGRAEIGAPPMSMPHLDTRYINGKKVLIFGPYAGFSTKFLKEGSSMDLPRSISSDNLFPMLSAGAHNLSLTKFLISQATQSHSDRMEALRKFIPDAKDEDWELTEAGMRVQVIKKDSKKGGILEFGTELVSSKDGSIAALLGASPGASTSAAIMLDLLATCFPTHMEEWKPKLIEMIPSYGKSLRNDSALTEVIRKWNHEMLQL